MHNHAYDRLLHYRPVNQFLAVNLTLLVRALHNDTEDAVEETLYEMGLHPFTKHTIDTQVRHIRRMCEGAQYQLRAPQPHAQAYDTPLRFDCSSLTQWAAGLLGFSLPRMTVEQFMTPVGELLTDVTNLKPFDIVFTTRFGGGWNVRDFRFSKDPDDITVGHCGLVLDTTTVLHAANGRHGVVEAPIERFLGEGKRPVRGVRRLYPDGENIVTMRVPERMGLDSAASLATRIRQHRFDKARHYSR